MKKIIVFLVALCAFATSAFAAVTISDWGISPNNNAAPIVYEGLMDDIAPSGFTVHADPEIWADSKANSPVILRDGESPWVAFQSNTVSPGLMINYKDTVSFAVNITGFNDLVFYRWGEPTETGKNILVSFADSDNKSVSYRTSWTGDGLYEFGYNQIVSYRPQLSDIEVSEVYIYLGTTSTTNIPDSYHLGDNTTGTVEFIFPDAEVPEPSSLLALAFGGAGTVLALRRRK